MVSITCSICLDNIINISNQLTLDCEHSFHKNCINKYFDISCPNCKQSFISSNIYYINTIHNNDNSSFKTVILVNNSIVKKLNNLFSLDISLKLFKLLNKHVIISGQFLLSIIQNSNENINELDIYIDNYSHYKKIKKFLQYDTFYKKNNLLNCNSYTNLKYLNLSNQIINNIKTYKYNINNNCYQINLIFNTNNEYTIKCLIKLDILKNYFDGNYFNIYDISKIELKRDYISKNKLDKNIQHIILYYRNLGYKIFVTS